MDAVEQGVPMVVRVGLGVVGVERGEANGVAVAPDSGEGFRQEEGTVMWDSSRNGVWKALAFYSWSQRQEGGKKSEAGLDPRGSPANKGRREKEGRR